MQGWEMGVAHVNNNIYLFNQHPWFWTGLQLGGKGPAEKWRPLGVSRATVCLGNPSAHTPIEDRTLGEPEAG